MASGAADIIDPTSQSKIHVMSCATQVTFVRSGKLKVKMKSSDDDCPYEVVLDADEAVLKKPGTLFQLANESFESCATFYVAHPTYLFEKSKNQVVYEDSLI
jgi:mannose-6-phosphate isomerase-like protein (cupin superfamily)